MEDGGTGEELVLRLSDPDWVVATEAALAIGKQCYRAAVPALIDAYQHRERREEVNIRIAVLEVLTGFVAADAFEIATEALQDPDKRIRTHAVELLSAIGQPATAPPDRAIYEANFDRTRRRLLMPPTGSRKAIITTRHGEIELELFGDDAVQTVASFVALAKKGRYDGLTFHRVVPNFVVQGGDPRGDGWGDAGYFIRSEFNRYRYETGYVGIAHDGKDTGGCQFFITHSPQPHLDGRYTIFARVTRGMETVYGIDQSDTFTVRIVE
jgi:cyclophilin family peptidyl-prolyl cis-trans isomerase